VLGKQTHTQTDRIGQALTACGSLQKDIDHANTLHTGECRTRVRQLIGTMRTEGECMMTCGACVPCAQGGASFGICSHANKFFMSSGRMLAVSVTWQPGMADVLGATAACTGDLICQRRSERMRKVAVKAQ
jgi:hypothetical protein